MRILMTGMVVGVLALGGCTSTGPGAASATGGVYTACGSFAGSPVSVPFVLQGGTVYAVVPGGRLEAFRSVGDGTYLRVSGAGISNLLAVKVEGDTVRSLPHAEAKALADRLGVRTINARWRICG